MKRLIILGLALLTIAALLLWGNRILARTLDAQLPQLLSRELGIPVTLGPLRARVSTLTAHTAKLVMGDPANPALVATRVRVSLDWSDLLRGKIRLRRAAGDTLMLNLSLWPENDSPWPTDYTFLEPYLPGYIALDSARYVTGDGASYAFNKAIWRRQSPGASLAWRDKRDGRAVDINLGLGSLDDLLNLADMKLQVTTTATGKQDSTVDAALEIHPGEQSGYKMTVRAHGAGMTANVLTGNSNAWVLPDSSDTSIKLLDIDKLWALVESYGADAAGADHEAMLAQALPRLSLPAHKGKVTIDQTHWRGEVLKDSVLDFITGPQGVTIPAVSSAGPSGALSGQVSVTSSDSGWQVGLEATVKASDTSHSLAAPYLEAHWFWREGEARMTGQGESWGKLFNSLQGDLTLSGSHRGEADTPITVSARLDNRPEELALDTIEVNFGKTRITGSAALSGDKQKRLAGKISATQLDLDLMLPEGDQTGRPGLEIPTFLDALSGVEMDWHLDASALTVSGLNFARTSIVFTRTPERGAFTANATGADGAQVDLQLDARMFADKPSEVTLSTDFSSLNVAKLFQQPEGVIESRASGNISFSSRAETLEKIFAAMKGTADLTFDFRSDRDWKRSSTPQEKVRVSGEAALVVDNSRITGLRISQLAIDSVLQNLTGSLTIVDGHKPWLEANLTSDKLDLDGLAKFMPAPAAGDATGGTLSSLKKLQDSRITLHAKSLRAAEILLSEVNLAVVSGSNTIDIEQLDFSLGQGKLTSTGDLSWLKDKATLSLEAQVKNVSLDRFLAGAPSVANTPLSGTVSLRSSGDTVSGLLAGLTGDIHLNTSPDGSNAASAAGAQIDMTARQTANGMHAEIHRFQWEGTDLSGSLEYHNTTPPMLEVEFGGGSLSLLPWEEATADRSKKDAEKTDSSIMSDTAKASAGMIGRVLTAPLKLISGPREAKPGEKVFSDTILPFDSLNQYQATIKGKLDKLTSLEAIASDVTFSASLLEGRFDAQASAGTFNGGSGSLKINIDATQTPTSVGLGGTFKDLRGPHTAARIPRSGYFSLTSSGSSQAELAGNVDGLAYLELGQGPLDYSNLMLLTADVATSVFQALIPSAGKKSQQLECGLTLGVFEDGIGTTPYGYAARTRHANLVGKIEVDLNKELLHLNFSSSSRRGVGLSVGNVFSNTVEVEGPLTDPRVIPNATGLAWRSWAAVMTAGLSVVGESVLKRALASEDPCLAVQKHIRKDYCGTGGLAAASPMVCPPA